MLIVFGKISQKNFEKETAQNADVSIFLALVP